MVDDPIAEASRLLALGEERHEADDFGSAAALYRAAIAHDATLARAWFLLGMATKHLGLWEESRGANRRALELDPQNEGAAWNLGIAGTALADWATAREGWQRAGIQVPGSEGPLEMNLGLVPIRVGRDATPEVVWCERLDPARGVIRNVPTGTSGRRYQDLVLHDGSGAGERMRNGKPVPVFNELQLLAPSRWSTYRLEVEAPVQEDVAALETILGSSGLVTEDWTASVLHLCAACSEGNPDRSAHAHAPEANWVCSRQVGVASRGDESELVASAKRWASTPPRRLVGLTTVIRGASYI